MRVLFADIDALDCGTLSDVYIVRTIARRGEIQAGGCQSRTEGRSKDHWLRTETEVCPQQWLDALPI